MPATLPRVAYRTGVVETALDLLAESLCENCYGTTAELRRPLAAYDTATHRYSPVAWVHTTEGDWPCDRPSPTLCDRHEYVVHADSGMCDTCAYESP